MKTGTRATLVTLLAISFLTSGGKSDSTQRSEAAHPPREVLPPIPSPTAAPKTTAAENAASVDPAAAQYLSQGIAQFKAGNIDGAIASYTSGIRLAPGLATLYFKRAFAYQFKSDFNAVIADANKALELKIDKADEAYDMRGAALTRLGNYRAAIEDCNRALSVNPNYAIAYANRANNEIRLRDLDGALADCNKSIAFNPSSSLPYYTRGYVYAYKGEASKAIADWDKAMQMQPAFRAELEPLVRKLGGRRQGRATGESIAGSQVTDSVNPAQRLVGTWQGGRHRMQYFADGTFVTDPHLVPNPPRGQWRVEGDRLIEYAPPSGITIKLNIVSVTDRDLVTRDDEGHTYRSTRIPEEQADREKANW